MFNLFKTKTPFIAVFETITSQIINGQMLTPDGNRYSKNTGKNYMTASFRFKIWEKENGLIYLEDISKKWAESFNIFLMSKGYAKNSIAATLSMLKAVLRRLCNDDICQYDGKGIVANGESVTTVYNSIEDIQKLLDCDLSNTQGQQKVRDIYILHTFLGLRFKDLHTFLTSPKNFIKYIGGNQFLEIKTAKTNTVVVIPISRVVKQILDRYNYDFKGLFSYQYYNESIKNIAAKAGVDDPVVFSRTEGGIRTDIVYKKNELMSSHTARRTFATNAFLSGMPLKNIMLITGHKTTHAFNKYIRCTNMDAAIKISNHDFFKIDFTPICVAVPVNNQKVISVILPHENRRPNSFL